MSSIFFSSLSKERAGGEALISASQGGSYSIPSNSTVKMRVL